MKFTKMLAKANKNIQKCLDEFAFLLKKVLPAWLAEHGFNEPLTTNHPAPIWCVYVVFLADSTNPDTILSVCYNYDPYLHESGTHDTAISGTAWAYKFDTSEQAAQAAQKIKNLLGA